jgi:hypothetical protein
MASEYVQCLKHLTYVVQAERGVPPRLNFLRLATLRICSTTHRQGLYTWVPAGGIHRAKPLDKIAISLHHVSRNLHTL